MTTTEPTAEDHIREARRYVAAAEGLADATSYAEGLRRTNDLQAAQVHATLAQTLKGAEMIRVLAAFAVSDAPAEPEAVPAAGESSP